MELFFENVTASYLNGPRSDIVEILSHLLALYKNSSLDAFLKLAMDARTSWLLMALVLLPSL